MKKEKAFRKKDLFILRAAINGFAATSREIHNKEILPNKELARWSAWEKKRTLGANARYHLLAYAFLLGKKYSEVEPGRTLTKHENRWQVDAVSKQILKICELYGGYRFYWFKQLTSETIATWIKTDENMFVWESAKPKTDSSTAKPKSSAAKILENMKKIGANILSGKTDGEAA